MLAAHTETNEIAKGIADRASRSHSCHSPSHGQRFAHWLRERGCERFLGGKRAA